MIEILHRQQVEKSLESIESEIFEIISYLYRNPEIGYQEYKACASLTNWLQRKGFQVKTNIGGLDTAFEAVIAKGTPRPQIAFLAEYDALPGMGHACGHNLIAGTALAAAYALASCQAGDNYSIKVIGTPAEEGIVSDAGGKIKLLHAGCFDNVDVVMMAHPGNETLVHLQFKAREALECIFTCVPQHASVLEIEGGNALHGAIFTFNAIQALRQHIPTTHILQGIIKEGGTLVNTIPQRAILQFYIKAPTNEELKQLIPKVLNCAKGGAMASHTELEVKAMAETYHENRINDPLARVYASQLTDLNIPHQFRKEASFSSDFGNVSQHIPGLHPYFAIGPWDLAFHTTAFADATTTKRALKGVLATAKALALTAARVIASRELLQNIKDVYHRGGAGS